MEFNSDVGLGKVKDKKEEFLFLIFEWLNEVFIIDNFIDKDMVNYVYMVWDKFSENSVVMM